MIDFDPFPAAGNRTVRASGDAGVSGVEMAFTLRPVRVETGCEDEEGRLVFRGGKLVAVLVRLSGRHGDGAGRWFLEHGFGGLDDPVPPCFPDLGAACA